MSIHFSHMFTLPLVLLSLHQLLSALEMWVGQSNNAPGKCGCHFSVFWFLFNTWIDTFIWITVERAHFHQDAYFVDTEGLKV